MTSDSAATFYRTAILAQVPRVLSLMDRERLSPTSGCCDRTFWAWKFVDLPRSRFQEALCVLGFLYATPLPESTYHKNPQLLEWIEFGLRFWASIQHRDGSFDEAYPFERSLAATAFTTFYVGECLRFVEPGLSADTRSLAHSAMARAGRWLARNDETHGFLSNHLAAAAAALLHAHRASGDALFQRRARYFLERILRHQSREGWYLEYGGADPGYQTHGSFYLARCWQMLGEAQLEASLTRSMDFLAHFVHADGSLGGEYASRNTQTYYPAAFEMMASRSPAASWIAERMRPSLENAAAASLRCIDSYNYFPFLNNYVFAYLACADAARSALTPQEPSASAGLCWFPEAGIARVRRERFDAYVGTAKGGTLKVFDRRQGRLVYSDCGYIGVLKGGRLFSSQYQDARLPVEVREDRVTLERDFCEVTRPVPSPFAFLLFRLFMLTLGRIPALARWVKNLLVSVLIYRKRRVAVRLRRVIVLSDVEIRVSDHLSGPGGVRAESLRWEQMFTTVHMGSSRYFIPNELQPCFHASGDVQRELPPERIASGLSLERRVRFDGEA